eukprot:Rmarinus@m.13914
MNSTFGEDAGKANRIRVYRQDDRIDGRGKLISVPSTLEQLLDRCTKVLNLSVVVGNTQTRARRLYTPDGVEINDIEEIRDRMDLVATTGRRYRGDPFYRTRREGRAPMPSARADPPTRPRVSLKRQMAEQRSVLMSQSMTSLSPEEGTSTGDDDSGQRRRRMGSSASTGGVRSPSPNSTSTSSAPFRRVIEKYERELALKDEQHSLELAKLKRNQDVYLRDARITAEKEMEKKAKDREKAERERVAQLLREKERAMALLGESFRKERAQLRREKTGLEGELTRLKNTRQQELSKMKCRADDILTKELQLEISNLQSRITLINEQRGDDVSKYRSHIRRALADTEQKVGEFRKEFTTLQQLVGILGSDVQSEVAHVSSQFMACYRQLMSQHEDIQARYTRECEQRRILYNKLQELRGNIRVYCRVRPMTNGDATCAVTCVSSDTVQIADPKRQGKRQYEFDRVYAPSTTQEEIFEDAKPLITSVLDGYNICLFAYGQTGAGKTYTMLGPPENEGVNIRALRELFSVIGERKGDYDISLRVSILEIYNESVRDLLADPSLTPLKNYEIKQHADGSMFVKDAVVAEIEDVQEAMDYLQLGIKNRSTSATLMSEASSRSHFIFSIYSCARNRSTGAKAMGKMHLIDLAGSERVSRSGVMGDRLKEAQAINRSLSSLGDVIHALTTKSGHVPYRNSKLTYLMQDSLGGSSKMLMYLQISPEENNRGESLCSLNFGARVQSVQLGPARRTIENEAPSSAASSPSAAQRSERLSPRTEPSSLPNGAVHLDHSEIDNMRTRLMEKTTECAVLDQQCKQLERDLKLAKEAADGGDVAREEDEKEAIRNTNMELEKKVAELQAELSVVKGAGTAESEGLREHLARLQADLSAKEKELRNLSGQLEAQQKMLDRDPAKAEVEKLRSLLAEKEALCRSVQHTLETQQKDLDDASKQTQQVPELQSRITSLENDLKEILERAEASEGKSRDAEAKLADERQVSSDLKEKINQLEKKVESSGGGTPVERLLAKQNEYAERMVKQKQSYEAKIKEMQRKLEENQGSGSITADFAKEFEEKKKEVALREAELRAQENILKKQSQEYFGRLQQLDKREKEIREREAAVGGSG